MVQTVDKGPRDGQGLVAGSAAVGGDHGASHWLDTWRDARGPVTRVDAGNPAHSSTGIDGPNKQFADSDPNTPGVPANLWIVQGIVAMARVCLPWLGPRPQDQQHLQPKGGTETCTQDNIKPAKRPPDQWPPT